MTEQTGGQVQAAPPPRGRRPRRPREPLTEVGYYRLTVQQLDLIEQAADVADQPLARWVRLALVREAQRQLNRPRLVE